MKFSNGWKSNTKQLDKLEFKFRVSFLTLLEIELDWSRRQYLVTIFNLSFHNKK